MAKLTPKRINEIVRIVRDVLDEAIERSDETIPVEARHWVYGQFPEWLRDKLESRT